MSARAELDRALLEAGFTARAGGKHCIWRHSSGCAVTLSVSPSDRRAFLNQRADVRRALRAVGAAVSV
jgi:hypothetical protein